MWRVLLGCFFVFQLTPLNIDTLCKDGKSKTIINKYKKDEKKELTEEERVQKQVRQQFWSIV